MHDVETDGGVGAGVLGGEVEHTATAARGELVSVAHERDACAGPVDDLQECAGGVLVEHSGLVDHEQVPGCEDRSWVSGFAVGLRPVAVVVPPPTPLMGQPRGRERRGVDLSGRDLGGL